MRNRWFPAALAIALAVAFVAGSFARAGAEAFKSARQCVPGMQVVDLRGRTGTVTGVTQTVMCSVRFPGEPRDESLLFWMLHPAGGSKETNDKLVPGKYECFAGGRYTFMDMYITGPNSYSSAGTHGTFTVLPSRKIVFHGGSLAKYYAHLLAGPAIGLNTTGDSFYATTCELKKG